MLLQTLERRLVHSFIVRRWPSSHQNRQKFQCSYNLCNVFSTCSTTWQKQQQQQRTNPRQCSYPVRMFSSEAIQEEREEVDDETTKKISSEFYSGPSLQLGVGRLARHTHASVVGCSGSTVCLCTVARSKDRDNTTLDTSFLTVEYRQKTAAVGLIPLVNRERNDSRSMSKPEILASRALDRCVRPLLRELDLTNGQAAHYHVHASVQSVSLFEENESGFYGHAVTTAINTAAAALGKQVLTQPVAATVLALDRDGNYYQDPGPLLYKQKDLVGELLLAGTPDGRVVMMEWTAESRIHGVDQVSDKAFMAIPEKELVNLMRVATAALQPIFDTQKEFSDILVKIEKDDMINNENTIKDGADTLDKEQEEIKRIRESLGLPALTAEQEKTSTTLSSPGDRHDHRMRRLEGAVKYCKERLGDSVHRLFGKEQGSFERHTEEGTKDSLNVFIQEDPLEMILKRVRGRREQIMQEEIVRLVNEFLDQMQEALLAKIPEGESPPDDPDRSWICKKTVYRLLRDALYETSVKYGCRSDRRRGQFAWQGWKTVRPLSLAVPSLPPAVHGSALFARGDTQVLCTATLGPPNEGQPLQDPFQPSRNAFVVPGITKDGAVEKDDDDETIKLENLPVGSLRFLRTQEALESDLNSRKVKADKERTGESGSLAEVKRAFLQYEFPAYSTGEVPLRAGGDRRSIGHGALAERAILSVLPNPDMFPYAVRITSEVTDSNGSSSMASVCGATLALLDAGVPIRAPVAGVSVGLAMGSNFTTIDDFGKDNDKNYNLLLDITGTEDHYGLMDFKIAGTQAGVTAVQLDVKEPLSINILSEALDIGKRGRVAMLDTMSKLVADSPISGLRCRPEPKSSAPRVEVVRFDPTRKRDLVGPGGVVLRQLEERYGVSLDLTQEGQCLLYGKNREMVRKARTTLMELVSDVIEGEVYTGTVVEVKDFGAILELLRNKEGLLHVSEIGSDNEDPRQHPDGTAGFVRQHLHVGQKVDVLCTGVDLVQGSIKLSQKALLKKLEEDRTGL